MSVRASSAGLLAVALLTALSADALHTPANAETSDASESLTELPESTEESDSPDVLGSPVGIEPLENAVETANYSDGNISLDYPATWQINVDETGEVGIANMPESPSDLVDTRLYQVDAPPGPLVDANIDSFIEEGAAVGRYRSVTIDGQSALVIWLADRPGDLSSAIATFIGYGDQTIFLFSRYSPENVDAESAILDIHGSFLNLADEAGASAESLTEESPFEESPSSEEGVEEENSEELSSAEETSPVDEEPILQTEELPLQNEEIQF